MILPRIPLLSAILRDILRVGTATYTTRGSEIIRSLFGPISITLYLAESPQQAENIVRQLNEVARRNVDRCDVYQIILEEHAKDCIGGDNAN